MADWYIDFGDDELFGNETAEDEAESNFLAYALVREEFETFINAAQKVRIVRAYKGEGKSALLRWTYLNLRHLKNVAVYENFAGSVLPNSRHLASRDYVQEWKEALLSGAAACLGSKIDLRFDDDVISLREEADRGGFRRRGFVSAVLARLKTIPGGPQLGGVTSPEGVLRRVAGANDIQIWMIIDDLDENFTDTDEDSIRVMSALVAMRQLSAQVKELWFRASIRPSTWAIIKRKYEALSKGVSDFLCVRRFGPEVSFSGPA